MSTQNKSRTRRCAIIPVSSNGRGTMGFAAIHLSLTALLAAAFAQAATTMPQEELKSRSARPLALEPVPDHDQLLELLALLDRSLELSAAAFTALTHAAAGVERALDEAPAFFVEGPLRDAVSSDKKNRHHFGEEERPNLDGRIISLAERTAAESRRFDRFVAILDALAELDRGVLSKMRVRRALKRLENRLRHLRSSYPALHERFESLGFNTARQAERLGADRLARTLRLQHAVRGLDWQIIRSLARMRKLYEKQ